MRPFFILLATTLFLFSCENRLKTEFLEEECSPHLYNPQYSWTDVATTTTKCSSGSFENSYRILTDVVGCVDTSASLVANVQYFDQVGNIVLNSNYNGQWTENINGKLIFGYCVNFSTAKWIKVKYKLVLGNGNQSNEVEITIKKPSP